MALQFFILKTGATLSLAGTVSLPTGTWTATSEVKTLDGTLVDVLSVTLAAPVSPSTLWTIQLFADAAVTETWPLGMLNCDIRYIDAGGNVIYTPTFQFNMVQEITDA